MSEFDPPGGDPPSGGLGLAPAGLLVWVVLGAVLILAFVGIDAVHTSDDEVLRVGENVKPEDAEVGVCIDILEEAGEVAMTSAPCDADHDGEIVGIEEVTDDNLEAIETGMADYCAEVLSAEDLTTIFERGDLELNAVIEDPDNVNIGDTLVCYAESTEGELDEKILDRPSPAALGRTG